MYNSVATTTLTPDHLILWHVQFRRDHHVKARPSNSMTCFIFLSIQPTSQSSDSKNELNMETSAVKSLIRSPVSVHRREIAIRRLLPVTLH